MAGEAIVYRNMTRADLDRAYDNRGAVPNHAQLRDARVAASAALYASAQVDRDVCYGPGERHRLDFFHCGKPARPTLMYIHGGYWQWNDKEPNAFVAAGPLACDINVAVVEYTLTPHASIDQISNEMMGAARWLLRRLASQFGASPTLVVSGHSAGGHLTAMALEVPGVHAGIAISGLYDLEPIRLGVLNDPMRMSRDDALRNSPMHRVPGQAPCIVAVGGAELPELVRQSVEYCAYLKQSGRTAHELVVPGDDHFTILDQLARPDGALCRALVKLVS